MTNEQNADNAYRLQELKIEVTHRCCLKCLHCSSEAGDDVTREMTLVDAVRLVQKAKNLGVEALAISGGEPIIWGGIIELLDAVERSELKLALYSSGVGNQTSDVLGRMARIPHARAIFSLYSHRPEVHDHITQCQGSHSTTVAAIRLASSLGLRTEVHFTAMRYNYQDLLEVCRLAQATEAQRLSVLRLVPQGRSRTDAARKLLSKEDNLRLQGLVEEARSIITTRVGSPYGFLHVSNSPKCTAGVSQLIVLPDLRISPCDAFKQVTAEQVAGTDDYSRLDRWSLADCWEKSPYLGAIRHHLQQPHVPPCRDCPSLHSCFSGCTAQRFLAHGALVRGPDPMCLRT